MDSLSKLKCFVCKILPDCADVQLCKNGHVTCNNCSRNSHGICKCSSLNKTVPNPILSKLKQSNVNESLLPCVFHDLGCTWKFSAANMSNHIEECRYRIINCIGVSLGIWECKWRGQVTKLCEHYKTSHLIGEMFSYFQEHSVHFNETYTIGTINLIDAFNKSFVFYYHSDQTKKLIFFTILLIGRKVEAQQFHYEFTIKSPEESKRKIKFVENIYTTNENIAEFINSGKCIVLTHANAKSHLFKNNIHFRFVISKKE